MHQKVKQQPAPKRLADLDYNELTELYNQEKRKEEPDNKRLRELMRAMRAWLRNEDIAMKEEEQKEKQASEKQKRILKETATKLAETRKEYLTDYRALNAFIKTRSAVTNVSEFETATEQFKKSSAKFTVALDAHIEKLKEAQKEDSNVVVLPE